MDQEKPIKICDLLVEQVDKEERKRLNKVLEYVIAVVRGQKVYTRHGKYIYDKEIHDLPYPENINFMCDKIIGIIRKFKE